MTLAEFTSIMAYLELGCGRPLSPKAAEVYFDLLGDLPFPVLKAAAQRVILEHPWNTFPSIAELRKASADTFQGHWTYLSPGEAWKLAWNAVCRIDPEQAGSAARACERLPPLVRKALETFGVVQLCCAKPEFARPQFMKIYEHLSAREQRQALLPAALKREIAAIGNAPPAALTMAIESIGVEKDA